MACILLSIWHRTVEGYRPPRSMLTGHILERVQWSRWSALCPGSFASPASHQRGYVSTGHEVRRTPVTQTLAPMPASIVPPYAHADAPCHTRAVSSYHPLSLYPYSL